MVISVNTNGTLQINTESFKHATGGASPAFSQKSAKGMEDVFGYIQKNAAAIAEDKKLKAALTNAMPELETLAGQAKANVEALTQLKGALGFQKSTQVEETVAGLVRNPLARNLLSDKELASMGVSDLKALDGFIAAKEKIAELAKDVTANKAAIRGVMIEHIGVEPKIVKEVFGKHDGVAKIKEIGKELAADMAKVSAKLDTAHAAIKGIDQELQNPLLKTKEITRLEAQRTKNMQKMVKATEGKDFGHQLFTSIEKSDPKLFEELKDISPEFEKHIDSVIKNGAAVAKATGENKWYSIFKGENALKETAKAEGIAVEKLGVLKKIRPGKTAAIAGIAAVGAYFVAGTGNKGPGERAEAAGKTAEPALGRA